MALAGQPGQGVLGLLAAAAPVHDHTVAALREGGGDGAADAAGRAGDQDGTGPGGAGLGPPE